ncbi:hypothetical protein [Pedosphaera parvula]|uniref:Uncharacterized protein n=1 Tax=Pedosphaera parvula (strain Ellin514) TaxID=320771 RepID=B9XG70_PEDPL|nr:hypothetical protein [Pedosphaera parvula]EEF61232.1 hypothetical protein Cflav_PD3949 [Pedosphaera parvula Ellin514]
MTAQKASYPHTIFWTVCAVLITWATITMVLEYNMGWPADRAAWGHRAIGWFVNVILVRTFVRGMRRYYAAKS